MDHLGKNLEAIAGRAGLSTVVFELVKWAKAQGRLDQLISASQAENPGNELLRKLGRTAASCGQPADAPFSGQKSSTMVIVQGDIKITGGDMNVAGESIEKNKTKGKSS